MTKESAKQPQKQGLGQSVARMGQNMSSSLVRCQLNATPSLTLHLLKLSKYLLINSKELRDHQVRQVEQIQKTRQTYLIMASTRGQLRIKASETSNQ
jgi:hypothetical protein